MTSAAAAVQTACTIGQGSSKGWKEDSTEAARWNTPREFLCPRGGLFFFSSHELYVNDRHLLFAARGQECGQTSRS